MSSGSKGKLSDVHYASRFRDLIRKTIAVEFNKIFPPDEFGTVVSVDTDNHKAYVLLVGNTTPIAVSYQSTFVPVLGDAVRVTGRSGSRYIAGGLVGSSTGGGLVFAQQSAGFAGSLGTEPGLFALSSVDPTDGAYVQTLMDATDINWFFTDGWDFVQVSASKFGSNHGLVYVVLGGTPDGSNTGYIYHVVDTNGSTHDAHTYWFAGASSEATAESWIEVKAKNTAATIRLEQASGQTTAPVSIQNHSNSKLFEVTASGALDLLEQSTPGSPAANVIRLYTVDNSGTTELRAKDSSGTVYTLAPVSAGYTDEQARDALGAALVGGVSIVITPNDGADTITIDHDGTDLYAANAAATGSVTVSFTTARVHKLTMTGNITTLTLSGATSGKACSLTLYLVQDGTGSRLVTWPASVKWPGGAAPVLSTAANAVDIVVLETLDGGTTWYANMAGRGYA